MRILVRIVAFVAIILVVALAAALYASDAHFGNWTKQATAQSFDASDKIDVVAADPGRRVQVNLSGRVATADGQPVAGAMVTASDGEGAYRVTVYSGVDGTYRLAGTFDGSVTARARASGFKDSTRQLNGSGAIDRDLDLVLEPLTEPQALSDSLTASAHAAKLKWPDVPMRSAFVSQCHFCHQIGNAFTRAPRSTEDWTEVVDRMEGYLVLLTDQQKDEIRDNLAVTFTGAPVEAIQTSDMSPKLATARIEEWTAGDENSFLHDADIGADGRLYAADEGGDVLWVLDRKTGSVERVPFPPSDLPVGGQFSGLALPIGIFTGKHGPHSLAQDQAGLFWITNALSSTLMAYHPDKKSFDVYALGGDALYPHTIRIDKDGIIWFTLAASNQVARFDPDSATFTIINLPSNDLVRWISDAFYPLVLKLSSYYPRGNLHLRLSHHKRFGLGKAVMTLPYGIDIHPIDGSVWYAKLYANRIGRIDPDTLEVREIETPLRGPRRPRFDSQGNLWIPSFEESAILKFDTQEVTFETYKLPQLSPGEYETPYALNVHPKTDEVWVTANQSDRIFRFDPKTEMFVSYPSPTRVTFLRDLVFTEDGKVCSSQSNLPAYAIEGGLPSFICIDPEGNAD